MPVGVYERTRPRIDKGGNYPRFWVHGKHENVFVAGEQKLKLPPLEVLNWLFRYEESSGKLYRIRESSGKVCDPEREITTINGSGYLQASITDSNGLEKMFQAHQLIYYMHNDIEPLQIVDHISGDKLDNRFSNLRLATDSGNSRNAKMRSHNTSGITGVYWDSRYKKWIARAYDNSGRKKFLGSFIDIEEAARVVSSFYANPENNYSERHGL